MWCVNKKICLHPVWLSDFNLSERRFFVLSGPAAGYLQRSIQRGSSRPRPSVCRYSQRPDRRGAQKRTKGWLFHCDDQNDVINVQYFYYLWYFLIDLSLLRWIIAECRRPDNPATRVLSQSCKVSDNECFWCFLLLFTEDWNVFALVIQIRAFSWWHLCGWWSADRLWAIGESLLGFWAARGGLLSWYSHHGQTDGQWASRGMCGNHRRDS